MAVAWYAGTMKVTIDAAGRLVIPKALRDAVGIASATTVELRERGGRLEIEVPTVEVLLEDRGGVHVAVPITQVPVLRADVVNATIEALRNER